MTSLTGYNLAGHSSGVVQYSEKKVMTSYEIGHLKTTQLHVLT